MKHIAIIGFGVVGGGIPEVIESLGESLERAVGDRVNVKYILDLRNFPDSPYGDRVVHSIDPILADEDVSLIAETMGGAHPAFEYSVAAMEHGKHVVTSNKEVVASYGDELLRVARKNGVSYLFEASVGGGIPVIRAFSTSLAGEKIAAVDGILNGTTNFILSKMKSEGRDFSDVLSEAQALGYAERDPSADIDGIDSKRKIMILAALCTGKLVSPEDVYCESIRGIAPADIDAASRMGGSVRLIASARLCGDKLSVSVCPKIVMSSCPLSSVSDVYNAISVTTESTGDVMFYGRGAGRYPTAGAVVDDIAAALSGAAAVERTPEFKKCAGAVEPFGSVPMSYYIRIAYGSLSDTVETCSCLFDKVKVLDGSADGKIELICGKASMDELDGLRSSIGEIESVIRIHE